MKKKKKKNKQTNKQNVVKIGIIWCVVRVEWAAPISIDKGSALTYYILHTTYLLHAA